MCEAKSSCMSLPTKRQNPALPHVLICSCRFSTDVCKHYRQVRFSSHCDQSMRELCETSQQKEKMWDGLLPPNVRHFPGLLCSASAVINEKQVPLESDSGLSFLDYYREAPLGAKNFPDEAASGNCVLWGGINLCLQISTLLP